MNKPKMSIDTHGVKGFLDPQEGQMLHDAALAAAPFGACLEIGGYCGLSALYLGTACKATNALLFSVDHHRGSEENQPGWEWHDPELWDGDAQSLDTLPTFRKTIRHAGLEHWVVPVVGSSAQVARYWNTPLGLLFIDGGHTMDAALADYRNWTPHLIKGGALAIHDVFPNPADGGRPPYEIYQRALASDQFVETAAIGSLRMLRRL
jgi:predicted O-methyltransferase YrrM